MWQEISSLFIIPLLVSVSSELIAWWLIRKFDNKGDK